MTLSEDVIAAKRITFRFESGLECGYQCGCGLVGPVDEQAPALRSRRTSLRSTGVDTALGAGGLSALSPGGGHGRVAPA
jgi:hypothetical protein